MSEVLSRGIRGGSGRRVHDWGGGRHATWLELFFDLVFVVAVARLGVLLHDDHSIGGVLVFAGLLVPLWWAWISFSYYADLFDDDQPLDRLAQLAAMLGAAVVAVTLGDGVDEDGAVFAGTFAVMFLLLAGLYAYTGRAEPRAGEFCRWYMVGSATGAALWGASILVPAPVRYVLWAAAVVVNALISGPIAYARVRSAPRQISHMPERFGLFTIVVLGEAVLAVINGIDATDWNAASVVTALAGFVIASCVWWIYFDQYDEAAIDQAIQSGRRAQVRSFMYGYGHLLVYAAIAATGVGVELAAEEAAHAGEAVPLLGVALAALIAGFIVISSGTGLPASRVVLVAKIALALLGLATPTAGLSAAPATVLIALGWVALVLLEGTVQSKKGSEPRAQAPSSLEQLVGGVADQCHGCDDQRDQHELGDPPQQPQALADALQREGHRSGGLARLLGLPLRRGVPRLVPRQQRRDSGHELLGRPAGQVAQACLIGLVVPSGLDRSIGGGGGHRLKETA